MDFKKVQAVLGREIKKYSNLPIADDDDLTSQPEAPYIALSQYGPVQTYTGAANSAFVRVHYQIKVITEGGTPDNNPTAKAQCANYADWLRKLWFFEQPKYDLLSQGIEPVQPCSTLGLNSLYLVNLNQFSDGADLTIVVRDDFVDNTRPRRLDVINYHNKNIRKE